MYQGLLAKFSQNKNLGEKLKITGNNFLAESSSNDTFWGTGMAMTNINAFDKTSWNGKNVLGILLMKVRDNLDNWHTYSAKQ